MAFCALEARLVHDHLVHGLLLARVHGRVAHAALGVAGLVEERREPGRLGPRLLRVCGETHRQTRHLSTRYRLPWPDCAPSPRAGLYRPVRRWRGHCDPNRYSHDHGFPVFRYRPRRTRRPACARFSSAPFRLR